MPQTGSEHGHSQVPCASSPWTGPAQCPSELTFRLGELNPWRAVIYQCPRGFYREGTGWVVGITPGFSALGHLDGIGPCAVAPHIYLVTGNRSRAPNSADSGPGCRAWCPPASKATQGEYHGASSLLRSAWPQTRLPCAAQTPPWLTLWPLGRRASHFLAASPPDQARIAGLDLPLGPARGLSPGIEASPPACLSRSPGGTW